MKDVNLYLKVRHAVRIEGLSERAAARRFGIDPRTVNKMMKFSVPPGYVRKKPPAKPKLDPFIPVIERILGDDKSRPKKQQHTAKRIFERLRDEHGFTGGITIVKDYVAGWRQRAQEMFVPLVHPPGHAQADSGHEGTIGERLERDLAAFQAPLPAPYDACEKVPTSVSSLSLVRYRLNDYSVPTTYGHRDVLVRGYVHDVVISCGAEVIARHPRSYEREDFVFEPLH